MDALSTYLILSGDLAPGEALLLKKMFDAPLKRSKAIKFIKTAGFSDFEKIISGLQTKQLIKSDNEIYYPDFKGIKIFVHEIEEKMVNIAHDLVELKMLTEERIKEPIESFYEDGSQIFSFEGFFSHFKGNKITKSEKKLLEGKSLISTLELIERLAEFGIVKITTKKRSRTISLTAEGAALRYLFLNKTFLNKMNYEWLENKFLVVNGESWDSFIKIINSEEDHAPWVKFVLKLCIELGVLINIEEEISLAEEESSLPFSITKRKKLEESVSGFIPVYVSHLRQVLVALKKYNKSKELQEALEFANSTLGGILGMLIKFGLAIKGDKRYSLTPEGQLLAKLSEDKFHDEFKKYMKDNLIFSETLKFVKNAPNSKIGFMDLVGYFRASGISNFNPAKALSVLRIMSETEFGILEVKGESRSYQLIESE